MFYAILADQQQLVTLIEVRLDSARASSGKQRFSYDFDCNEGSSRLDRENL